jgi:hypothetical protein
MTLELHTSGYNYSKRRCKQVVEWLINKHLPRHKIEISVHHRGLYREGVYGWVWATDCDYRPRSFEIEMHNFMTPEHYTITLLHECWHVYQHVTGALKDRYGKRHWKGIDCSNLNYEEMPWEEQAHQMEQVLYEEYLYYLTNTQKSL